MRKVHQKVILLVISSALCVFFLQNRWKKHLFLIGCTSNNELASMAMVPWLHRDRANPQYSQESQERRTANVRSVCERNNLTNSSFVLDRKVAAQLYVEHSHKFIYCEVPKVGCSNWKRIILILNESLGLTVNDLAHYKVHSSKLLIKLSSYPPSLQKQLLANYTKVMFTRNPLERVVSAYRDKFLHNDDIYYSKTIANLIRNTLGIESKANITFQQFVRFIVKENPSYRDTHWKPMYQLCDPCNIQYDFVGKFETVEEDADFVLRTIGAPKNLKYPSMKHHPNESRTNKDISKHYLKMLPPSLLSEFIKVYSLDFSMFGYSYYNGVISKVPKTI